MATPQKAPVLQTCIVCGMQSHRTDWINKQGDYVACDRHQKAEFQRAIVDKNNATASASSAAAAPVTSPATTPAADANVIVK